MHQLTDKIYYVGVKDYDLKKFDILFDTEYGTTYNSYLIKGEKTALIETVHNKLSDDYINNIEEITPLANIDYIICNHTEPDHTGALERILVMNPDITVVGTIAALKNIKKITDIPFKEMLAKDGETLDLGGISLKFIITPNLHWPDTMMTYCVEEKALFSCDFLGAHYSFDGILDTDIANLEDYDKAYKHYYKSILSPFKPFVQKGIEKVSSLDFDMLCSSHGPVLTKYIRSGLNKYLSWSKLESNSPKKATIVYVSAHGYTKMLAECAKDTLTSEGYDVRLYDLENTNIATVIDAVHSSRYVLLGTPTFNRNALKPIWDIATSLDVITAKDIRFAVFGSYGWSGEGPLLIQSTLKNMRLSVTDEPFRVIFKPTDTDLEKMREYVINFAKDNSGE